VATCRLYSTNTSPITNGEAALTWGVASKVLVSGSACSINPPVTVTCACMPISFSRSVRSNPVITEITTINAQTPITTPANEISVMIDTNVRFGFRYRKPRKSSKGNRVMHRTDTRRQAVLSTVNHRPALSPSPCFATLPGMNRRGKACRRYRREVKYER